MPPVAKTCAVTGASGFVGGKIGEFLQGRGWSVMRWVRGPAAGLPDVRFILGQRVDPERFKGIEALVHCAYDFGPRSWDDIVTTNVTGTHDLLLAARKAGVQAIVLISSLSAFPGCRSQYGRAKLQTEAIAQTLGVHVIRPGLVYGDQPGGMFGRLVRQVRTSPVIPVVWGGRQTQYLLHADDLGELVLGCLDGRVPPGDGPVSAAHQQGWELKEIMRQIADALHRKTFLVPVPWPIVWLALRTLEGVGVRANFRSDSLLSLVYQNPHPSFANLSTFGIKYRPFRLSPGMLA